MALRLVSGFAAGAAIGYLAERAIVRSLVAPFDPSRSSFGAIRGTAVTIQGPDGVELAVETYGPESAPQLVVAHGWLCTARVWHAQIAALAGRYRIISYDQPGHGRSGPPSSGEYTLDLLGDALIEVINQVARPGRVALAGHSLGGMTVLNAARRYRDVIDRRVGSTVLISTTSRARDDRSRYFGVPFGIEGLARFERLLRHLSPEVRQLVATEIGDRDYTSTDLSRLLVRWAGVGPHADPTVAALAHHMIASADPDLAIGLLHAIADVDEDDGLAVLADLGIPTVVMVGSRDRLTPRGLSTRMVDRGASELIELADAGHLLPLEAPLAVNATLERHLDALSAPVRRQVRRPTRRWRLPTPGHIAAASTAAVGRASVRGLKRLIGR